MNVYKFLIWWKLKCTNVINTYCMWRIRYHCRSIGMGKASMTAILNQTEQPQDTIRSKFGTSLTTKKWKNCRLYPHVVILIMIITARIGSITRFSITQRLQFEKTLIRSANAINLCNWMIKISTGNVFLEKLCRFKTKICEIVCSLQPPKSYLLLIRLKNCCKYM